MKTSLLSIFLCTTLTLGLPLPVCEAQSPPIREEEPDPVPPEDAAPGPSRVVQLEWPHLVQRFLVDSSGVAAALDRGVLALTRASDLKAAWSSFVSPEESVAIKIHTAGGPITASHAAIVNRVVHGLKLAGVSSARISVWDKNPFDMISAGYVPMQPDHEWKCEAVIDGRGWNPEKFYFHEVVGNLIWSDQDFVGAAEARKKPANALPPGDIEAQISNRSYYARIMTDADKIINIAPMSDHRKIGLIGAYSSLILGSIDNHRRFLSPDRTSAQALAEIYAESGLKEKTALHIVDGLVAQYAGGPAFDPNFASTPGLLMLSQDPVALDTLTLQRLEAWREAKSVPLIGDQAIHLRAADAWGHGHHDPDEIEIVSISSQNSVLLK